MLECGRALGCMLARQCWNLVLWFIPSRQLSTTQLLAHSSLPCQDGGENQKSKSEKTCGLR